MSVGHLAVVDPAAKPRTNGERGQVEDDALPRTVANPKQGVLRRFKFVGGCKIGGELGVSELGVSLIYAEG